MTDKPFAEVRPYVSPRGNELVDFTGYVLREELQRIAAALDACGLEGDGVSGPAGTTNSYSGESQVTAQRMTG